MKLISILLLCLGLFAGTAFADEPYQLVPPRAADEAVSVRAAVLLPLTGPMAAVGAEMRRAIEFALIGSRNPGVILQFYDDGGTKDKAREAVKRAKQEQADIVIGPLLKDAADGVRREGGLKAISFTTSSDVLSSDVVSVGFMPDDQVEAIISFAASRGVQRFAVITPKSESGKIIRDLARDKIRDVRGKAVYDEQYVKGDISKLAERVSNYAARTKEYEEHVAKVERRLHYLQSLAHDFPDELAGAFDSENYSSARAEIAALERMIEDLKKKNTISPPPFDAVFLAGDDMNDIIMLGSMLLYYDVRSEDVKFLGLSQLAHDRVYDERAFRGAWFPLAPSRYQAQFAEAFEKYLGAPPSRLALLAYDAAALVASGLATEDGLRSKDGFSGLSGVFRFKSDGRSERLMEIREVVGGRTKSRVLQPANVEF